MVNMVRISDYMYLNLLQHLSIQICYNVKYLHMLERQVMQN